MLINTDVTTIAPTRNITREMFLEEFELQRRYEEETSKFEALVNENGDIFQVFNYCQENNLCEMAFAEMTENLRKNEDLSDAWNSINPNILATRYGPFLSERALADYNGLAGIESISAMRERDNPPLGLFNPNLNTVEIGEQEVGFKTIQRFLDFKKGIWAVEFSEIYTLAHELEHYNFTGDFKFGLPVVIDNSRLGRFLNKSLLDSVVDLDLYGSSPSYNFIAEWFSILAESEVGAHRYIKDHATKTILEDPAHYLSGRELENEELGALSDKLATLVVVSGLDSSELSIVLRNQILEALGKDQKAVEISRMIDLLDRMIYDYVGFKCDEELTNKSHKILSARTKLRQMQFMSVIGKSLVDVAKGSAKENPLLWHRSNDLYSDDDSEESIWLGYVNGKFILQSLEDSMPRSYPRHNIRKN